MTECLNTSQVLSLGDVDMVFINYGEQVLL